MLLKLPILTSSPRCVAAALTFTGADTGSIWFLENTSEHMDNLNSFSGDFSAIRAILGSAKINIVDSYTGIYVNMSSSPQTSPRPEALVGRPPGLAFHWLWFCMPRVFSLWSRELTPVKSKGSSANGTEV